MPGILFRVEFVKSAKKEFNKLPSAIQNIIIEAVRLLRLNPFSELLKIKKLKGAPNLYRVRISDWRLVYEINREAHLIVVIKIAHRSEVYHHL